MSGARDLSNQRFGDLMADHPTDKRDSGSVVWSCRCLRCGSTCEVSARNLVNGHTASCGCARGRQVKPGDEFGSLKVKERAGSNEKGKSLWLCECECGNKVTALGIVLRRGDITSCGCNATKKKRLLEANGSVDGTRLSLLNGKLPKNNTSGVRGVVRDKRRGGWIAQIKFQGKHRYLGHFTDLADAAEARRQAEQELFDPVLEEHGMAPTSEDAYEAALRAAVDKEKEN